jgi:sec-independent protein translocase protein TatC
MAHSLRHLPHPRIKIPRLPEITDEPDVFEEMTLQEHLEELRDRILKTVLAIVPAFLVGFFFAHYVLDDIAHKANTATGLDVRSPTDTITLTFKVALYVAVGICMPVIVYQVVAFLAPGLTRREKRVLFSALPFTTILFAAGAVYGYFVAAPRALHFLSSWNSGAFNWQPDGNETVSFFLTLTVGIGIAFQLPLVMFIMAKIGVVTPRQMRRIRRYALLVIMIAAAIITPSTDPYNMMVVAVPLYVLYEGGIVISTFFARTTFRTTPIGARKAAPAIEQGRDV